MPIRHLVIKNLRRLALLATVFLFCGACYHPRISTDCRLSNPDDSLTIIFTSVHKLNVKLEEVSGISLDSKGLLWCINDEKGILFQLDTTHQIIAAELTFGPPGDYEGLAIRNDTAFVIRSDATIFEFALDDPNSLSVKKIQQLPAKCETESITSRDYDLFTICKTPNNQGRHFIYKLVDSGNSYKAVEEFDLTGCLTDFLTQHGINNKYRPTDLFYDHKNKWWLMSAAKPASLAIFDENGNWVFGSILDAKEWPQPEGLCQLNDPSYVLTSESKGYGILGQFKVE